MLGIDFGQRKVGLALGDSVSGVAVPLGVIPGGGDLVLRINKLILEEGIEGLVLGVAIPEAHQSPTQYNRTMHFAGELKTATGLAVQFVDEQFSSAEAKRVQRESVATAGEDALAAMVILQAYFDEGPDQRLV